MIDRTQPLLTLTWPWYGRALIVAAAILALLFVCALLCGLVGGFIYLVCLLIAIVIYVVAYAIALLPILAALGVLGALGASQKDSSEKAGGGCAAILVIIGFFWFMSWSNWWSNTTGVPPKMCGPLMDWATEVWNATTNAAGACCTGFFTYRVYLFSASAIAAALFVGGATLATIAAVRGDRFFSSWFGRIHFQCPRCRNATTLVCCPQCGTGHDDLLPSRYGIWSNQCRCGNALGTTRARQASLAKKCAACQFDLQHPQLGQLPEFHFAVVGAQGSGKTTLLTAALDYLEQEFAPSNGLEVTVAATADGKEHYQRVQRLKARQSQAPTPPAVRPLALQVSLRDPKTERGCLLYLYDASGLDIQSGAWTGDGVGGHDFHAFIDGVILVMDALAEQGIRRRAEAQAGGPPLSGSDTRDAHYILCRLLPFWASAQHRKHQERFIFPLAVVVSKLDTCRLADSLGGLAATDRKPGTLAAVVHAAKTQSPQVRKLLQDAESNDLLQLLDSHFRRICYFGSRLPVGGSGTGAAGSHGEASAPLLWLMDQAGAGKPTVLRNCLGRVSRCMRGLEGKRTQRIVWSVFAASTALIALGLGWLIGFWLGGFLALLLALGARAFLISRC